MEITSQFVIKDNILNVSNNSENFRTCANNMKRTPIAAKLPKEIKTVLYQRPCTVQTARSEDCKNTQNKIRKQRAVCHTRDFKDAAKKLPSESVYAKLTGRRVSIASRLVKYLFFYLQFVIKSRKMF